MTHLKDISSSVQSDALHLNLQEFISEHLLNQQWKRRNILHKLILSMNGENRHLVAHEPVGVQEFKKITDYFRGIYRIYIDLIMKKPKDLNMQPVGFGNTRILTDYA